MLCYALHPTCRVVKGFGGIVSAQAVPSGVVAAL